ncbi:conjugal transfer protein [Pantoea sp. EABMAA-21]|uniref:helix-turn-helix transcriptional regulator n=1 Tax=Pantoea sp. EABMAA-21 TaxID=3043302 RepID=UPI0024B583BD|nr:conjugal transfer protein [Pantoea sp. EABMAA-21]MDI9280416.1 conjugal transfer protein [Pantoea sp. EABMAA-21]
MAAVDPIVYAQLCKLFPELTLLQVTDTCLYSAGATYKETGELRGVSAETIKKSLEAARKRLEISNLQSLRLIFLSRVFLSFKLSLPHLAKDNSRLSNAHLSEVDNFISLLPELSLKQAKCVYQFAKGIPADIAAERLDSTPDEIMKMMETVLSRLQICSLNALRVFIFSKLLINLALD